MVKLLLLLALIGCNHVPNPAVIQAHAEYTPTYVASSVYKLDMRLGPMLLGSGTGWKVVEDMLVTAGHVCASVKATPGALLYAVPGIGSTEQVVVVERFEYDGEKGTDLCLLYAPGIPGAPLTRIAPDPEYGDELCYTGAPKGIFGGGLIPHDCGPYQGATYVMLDAERGASGSPIYTKEGVVGVLVSMASGLPLFHYIPGGELRRFLGAK